MHVLFDALKQFRRAFGVFGRNRDRHFHSGQGTSQFVTHVMKKPLLTSQQSVDFFGHRVVLLCKGPDFIVTVPDFGGNAHGKIPFGSALHGPVKLFNGAGKVPG